MGKYQYDSLMSEENGPISALFPPTLPLFEDGSFLQSPEWADFQRSVGRKVIAVPSTKRSLHAFKNELPLGLSYLYVPQADVSETALKELIKAGEEEKALFLRIEPWNQPLTCSGYTFVRTASRQPQYSLCVPVKKEEEMLRAMHTKTRYNIGLSERKEVQVKKIKDVDIFWRLLQDTTKRDGFRAHGKEYYEKMVTIPVVEQYVAFASGVPVASIITIRHGATVVYLHGASLHEYRNLMAPYALQWAALKDAFSSGALWYDMWGVAPPAESHNAHAETFHTYTWDTRHSFHGITRFKAGFGGIPVTHPSAVEIPLRPWLYKLYRIRQCFIG